jgi:hypothetical protein
LKVKNIRNIGFCLLEKKFKRRKEKEGGVKGKEKCVFEEKKERKTRSRREKNYTYVFPTGKELGQK